MSLSGLRGRRVALYFFPKSSTPGCTREAIDFNQLRREFEACGTTIFGVSADPPRPQKITRTKCDVGFPLASDAGHALLKAHGARAEKSMCGRTFMGIVRSTFLLGTDRRIARVWQNVKVPGHAEEVLAAAEAA